MTEHSEPMRGRLRRLLYVELGLSPRQVRIAVTLLAIVLVVVVYVVVVSMLPHHVLETMLEYEEKSNGTREHFGPKARTAPALLSR